MVRWESALPVGSCYQIVPAVVCRFRSVRGGAFRVEVLRKEIPPTLLRGEFLEQPLLQTQTLQL